MCCLCLYILSIFFFLRNSSGRGSTSNDIDHWSYRAYLYFFDNQYGIYTIYTPIKWKGQLLPVRKIYWIHCGQHTSNRLRSLGSHTHRNSRQTCSFRDLRTFSSAVHAALFLYPIRLPSPPPQHLTTAMHPSIVSESNFKKHYKTFIFIYQGLKATSPLTGRSVIYLFYYQAGFRVEVGALFYFSLHFLVGLIQNLSTRITII